MLPRFVGRTGLADAVTVGNAILGFLAVLVAFENTWLAARLLLLAAILDGLDGVVARHRGGTAAGPYLDSLADVASFAITPAVLVHVAVADHWGVAAFDPTDPQAILSVGVPAVFVGAAITRLGLYTAYDTAESHTEGVPTTLAATIIGAAVLAEAAAPSLLLVAAGLFSYLMLSPLQYPDLLARDALIMGVVHGLAVLVPSAFGRAFPWALLFLGAAYLLLSPWFYWRDSLGFSSGVSQ